MKALTIRQPWAWAIAAGHKDVENRGWATQHRGLLAIHAGKAYDAPESSFLVVEDLTGEVIPPFACGHPSETLGAVVAVAAVIDCHRDDGHERECCSWSPWAADGKVHWQLRYVRRLTEPLACRGAQGLWTLPTDVEAQVRAQLEVLPGRRLVETVQTGGVL